MREEIAKDGVATPASPNLEKTGGDDHSIVASGEPEIDDAHTRSRGSSIVAEQEKNDPEDPVPLSRMSTELGPAVVVPRLKRRGLFGQLTLVAEVEDPKTYPRKMKWFITFIVAVAGATAPMGSSIFFRELTRRKFFQYLHC